MPAGFVRKNRHQDDKMCPAIFHSGAVFRFAALLYPFAVQHDVVEPVTSFIAPEKWGCIDLGRPGQ